MSIEWNQSLSVDVKEIDEQHRELFKRINDLRTAVSEGRGKSEIGKTVAFLEDYVYKHFSMEERLMRQSHYNGYAGHHHEHEIFRKELADLKRKLESLLARREVTSFLTIEIERKLADWFVNHVGQVDREMGAYLKGIAAGPARQGEA